MELDQKALFALLAMKIAQRMMDQADVGFATRQIDAAGFADIEVHRDENTGQVAARLEPAQAAALFAEMHAYVRSVYPALHSLGTTNLAYYAGQIINEYLAEGFESLQQAEIGSSRPKPAA